jgi:alkyl sulfatase BDS1-like metallo-beta-lactamase superfamily hydrolase
MSAPPSPARRGAAIVRTDAFQPHLVPGVHRLPGQGNSLAIETERGVVLVDAGPGRRATATMIERLRSVTDLPVSHIVYSHGHVGYNDGVAQWRTEAAGHGHPRPVTVAHARVADRYRRYAETAGLQAWLNSRQFRAAVRPPTADVFTMPDLAYEERLVIDGGDRQVVLLAAPSETDDTTAVWLPAERFLYGSAAVVSSIPNVGTPLRTWRDPMRWADTLERLHALGPTTVLGEFGPPVADPKGIDDLLLVPVAGLRWLREQVVQRMNAGLHIDDIVHEVPLPEAIFGSRFMRPIYGAPEYVMRDIWRSENGWWDRNPTTLHPSDPDTAARDLADAIGATADDAAHVVGEARRLAEAGHTQRAMHVLDLVAHQPPDAPGHADAIALKAELCRRRATQVTSVVSRNLYRSAAEDLEGLPLGTTRADDPVQDFSWE